MRTCELVRSLDRAYLYADLHMRFLHASGGVRVSAQALYLLVRCAGFSAGVAHMRIDQRVHALEFVFSCVRARKVGACVRSRVCLRVHTRVPISTFVRS